LEDITLFFLTDAATSLLENLCAITLYKRYNLDDEPRLFYYNKNVEIDFFVPSEGLAIQASYSISDVATREREINGLVDINKVYPLKRAVIITYDEEELIDEGDLKVEAIPIWKWLAVQ
jgi:predicted AAA+ superfamily ATPase